MKSIFKYLRPFVSSMALGLTIKTAATVFELALPYILSYILGNIVPLRNAKTIVYWGLLMILCAALALVGNITANRMAAKVARNATEKIRHDLFQSTMLLTTRDFDRFTVPSLESRITSDTYNVHGFIGMMQRMGVRAPILLIGGIAISLTLDPVLSLCMLAVLPLISLTVLSVSKKGIPLYTEVQASADKMTRIVREDSQGIRVIKAVSRVEHEKRRFEAANDNLTDAGKRAGKTMAVTNPIITLLLNLGLACVIIVGAYRVNAGLTGAEKIIAFMQYFTLISMAMMSITRIFMMYSRGSASATRISEITSAVSNLPTYPEKDFPRLRSGTGGYIKFDNVCFSYNHRVNNINELSFTLEKGQTLGIIGATGSGKTTLLKLLLRLYDTDSGNIYIGGKNIRTYENAEFRRLFGCAFQSDFLYSDTIAENIRFGREISEADIREAARVAQADGFISALEDGYGHVLTQRATNLSGGQKQRLLIARAVASNPDILILDDSSSALDYKTESNLRAALRERRGSFATVIVGQRVSSVMNADLILVLEDGGVIGSGTHDSLIESCPTYAAISESQMGGAILD